MKVEREEDRSVSQKSKDSVYICKNVWASTMVGISKAYNVFHPQNVIMLQSISKCAAE